MTLKRIFHRREFLQAGLAGFAGLALPDLLRLRAQAPRPGTDERTAIIYLVDPNNPLGIRYTREEIESFAAIARDCGALLVHDCTYRDFADGHTPALHIAPVSADYTKPFTLPRVATGPAGPVDRVRGVHRSPSRSMLVRQRVRLRRWVRRGQRYAIRRH